MNDNTLIAAILTLPCKEYDGTDAYTHYCRGHRDARHAAAELVSASLCAPHADIGMVCPTAPERIWLQSDPEPETAGEPVYTGDEVTWCADKINDTDTLYVRADLAAPVSPAPTIQTMTDEQIIDKFKENGVLKIPSRSLSDPDGLKFMVAVGRAILSASAAPTQQPSFSQEPRAPMSHQLKTDSEVFHAVADGRKKFEIRKADRDFRVGDVLDLLETASTGAEMAAGAPLEYTGGQVLVKVTHILHGPVYGLAAGWCLMSIEPASAAQPGVMQQWREEAERLIAIYANNVARNAKQVGVSCGREVESTSLSALLAHLSAVPAAAPAAQPMDAGPWSVVESVGSAIVSSGDFTHDVCLRIDGDFASPAERRDYAVQLCAKLNAPAAPDALSRSHELLRQAVDELIYANRGSPLDSVTRLIAAITAYLPKETT